MSDESGRPPSRAAPAHRRRNRAVDGGCAQRRAPARGGAAGPLAAQAATRSSAGAGAERSAVGAADEKAETFGAAPLAPLERRLKRELRRGRAAINDALDLHGYNQAEAHYALRGFLISAQARGLKLVVVVTGKGSGPRNTTSWLDEPGVLRRLAPHWLREADMRPVVLGFEEAGPAHGGAGALYVRLRRRAPVR